MFDITLGDSVEISYKCSVFDITLGESVVVCGRDNCRDRYKVWGFNVTLGVSVGV